MFKKLLFLVLIFGTVASSEAATVSSISNGNWTDGAIWSTGTPPQSGDEVTIAHHVMLNTSITSTATITIIHGASLKKSGNSQDVQIAAGAVFFNHGVFICRNLDLSGILYNYHSGLSPDSVVVSNSCDVLAGGNIQNEGNFQVPTLTVHAGGSVYNLLPIGVFVITTKLDNAGLVDNDFIISVSGNLINNTGTLTGNGGTYYCNPTLTNNSGSMITCSGLPINICRPDGTNPIVNGSGTVNYPCALLCNGPWPQPQPIIFGTFTAESEAEAINLMWKTESELNMKEFSIEKATPLIEETCKMKSCGSYIEFTEIGRVKAKGNVGGQYSFQDKNPIAGVQYYRLRAIFINQEHDTYSHVVTAYYNEDETSLTVFPNPSQDKLSIHLTGPANVEAKVILYTIDGRRVWEATNPMTTGSADYAIRSCDFAAGIYLVTMEQGSRILSKKVIFKD